MSLSIFEYAGICEAVRHFELAEAMHDASNNLTGVCATIAKEDLALTVRLIRSKVAFEHGSITEKQLAEAMSDIHGPVTFVVLLAEVTAPVIYLSVTVLFAAEEFSDVLGAVVIGPRSLSTDLAILKHASKLAAITHYEHTFACLPTALKGALVLEVWIRVCIASYAMSKLRDWVDGAHISILGQLVLEVALSERRCLHLWMVLVERSRVSRIVLLTH